MELPSTGGTQPCFPGTGCLDHGLGTELPGAGEKPWTLPVVAACQGPLSTHNCAGGRGARVGDGRLSPQHTPRWQVQVPTPRRPHFWCVGGGLSQGLHVSDKTPGAQSPCWPPADGVEPLCQEACLGSAPGIWAQVGTPAGPTRKGQPCHPLDRGGLGVGEGLLTLRWGSAPHRGATRGPGYSAKTLSSQILGTQRETQPTRLEGEKHCGKTAGAGVWVPVRRLSSEGGRGLLGTQSGRYAELG